MALYSVETVVVYYKDSNELVFIIPREIIETDPDHFVINIDLQLFSGNNADFEQKASAEMFYSNYKIEATMGMQTDNGLNTSYLPNSNKYDYEIYKNARLISEVIDLASVEE